MTFDEWLDTRNASGVVDFHDSREQLQVIWAAATAVERDRCKQKCKELYDEPPYKDYEKEYFDGWLDACNECEWAINGSIPKYEVYTEEEISIAAIIGKAYFDLNRPAKVEMNFFSTNGRTSNISQIDGSELTPDAEPSKA